MIDFVMNGSDSLTATFPAGQIGPTTQRTQYPINLISSTIKATAALCNVQCGNYPVGSGSPAGAPNWFRARAFVAQYTTSDGNVVLVGGPHATAENVTQVLFCVEIEASVQETADDVSISAEGIFSVFVSSSS